MNNSRRMLSNEVEDFYCEICFMFNPSNKLFDNKVCVHPFCRDCIVKYIETQVMCSYVANLKCPDLNCDKFLDPLNCRPIIANEYFVKWSDNLCDLAVLKYQRCYCPNFKCSVLVVNESGGTVTKVNCPVCKTCFCFKCKCHWHSGYRCNETGMIKDKNDILIGKLIEREKWTRCPTCGHSVQRISGCSSIKCRCGQEFCHICGTIHENMHSCIRPSYNATGGRIEGDRDDEIFFYCMIFVVVCALFLFALSYNE